VAHPGKRRYAALIPWLCLVALPLLYELPAMLRSTRIEPARLRLSLEIPLLLSLWLAALGGSARPALRRALSGAAWLLVIYRLDQWLCWTLMQAEPLLYDQWFMLRHLWVLIGDLMSLHTALILGGLALGGALCARLTRWLLDRSRVLATPEQKRHSLRVGAAIWCVLLGLSAAGMGSEDPWVRWSTPAIVQNVVTSRATYLEVQKRLQKSPYTDYARLRLTDTPDVYLFLVESYGRLLSVEEKTRAQHAALLQDLSQQLETAGWHVASAFITATVSGGRSWIAEGNILLGTSIRYEAVFQHLVAQHPPSLVSFLRQNGYRTVLLAPADRHRLGTHPVNRYGFERLISFDDLSYHGPHVGWGMVPDQYSLAFTERHALRNAGRPVFLDFHMVSSHAPWQEVPRFEETPERLLSRSGNVPAPELTAGSLVTPFTRYERGPAQFAYMERFDAEMRNGYQACVEYSLRTIVQYLKSRERDAFVIAIGDHQPPVIAREDASFDTPIHVFSRDATRLAPLLARGFKPGLQLDPHTQPLMMQAGLLSLFVHSLMAKDCAEDDPSCSLPKVLPRGESVLAR
jgi:hypothetical protein